MSTIIERFWSKVVKDGPVLVKELGPCWLWAGSVRNKRYGDIWVNGKNELAHRVAWLLETGKWPKPHALHKCDNTLCVRFSHLFEGTQQDNSDDRGAKGRNNHISKLTVEDVRSIRKALTSGVTKTRLAEQYGVTRPNILHIEKRKSWANI